MSSSRLRRGVPVLAFVASGSGVAWAQPVSPTPEPATSRDADVTALREEVRALRERMEARDAAPPSSPSGPPPRPLGYERFWPWVLPPEGLSLGGYLQSQYESHQDSQDQLAQGGAVLNQDRFSIRRARVSVAGEWTYAAVALELDGNTTSGPQVDLHKAEASLQYRPDRTRPPMLMATVGLFDVPFGYELVESPATRWFMERSTASRAWFPSEPDVGLRLAGALGFFRWTIAAQNGEPFGEKSPFVLQDPNKSKDVVFRFGFDATPLGNLNLAGDVSALRGTGFHAGTDATHSSIQWTDQNEDGIVQPYELTPVSGGAATPSQNFDRWAVGVDLRAHLRWWLGTAKVYGGVVLAQNLDRGLYFADPILTGIDQRELGGYVAVVQEVTRWGVAGVRFDYYDPNLDASDKRAGKLLPFSEAITTVSPLVGLVLRDRARLLLQYDFNHNALARDVTGVPASLKSDAVVLRLQVQL